jgi:DNA-binding transcriptional ArsR family regulator
MVESRTASLNVVFHALADPTRRDMLRRLAKSEYSIGELAAPLDMSFAGASKHVKALEKAGLITRRLEGRAHICTLRAEPMERASNWLRFYEAFWNARLDRLAALLEEEECPKNQALPSRAGSKRRRKKSTKPGRSPAK